MKALTVKQRRAIYLKIANMFEKVKDFEAFDCTDVSQFVCDNIRNVDKPKIGFVLDDDKFKELFPEFFLFEPEEEKHEGKYIGWWETECLNGLKIRATALYLCVEMCN